MSSTGRLRLPKAFGALFLCVSFTAGWFIRHPVAPVLENLKDPPGFAFEDDTKKLGIDFTYRRPKLDPTIDGKSEMLFVGTGVAVADFNGDGWMDILLVNAEKGEKNHLYINQGGKGFKESAEEWGIADTNATGATVTPVIFDYDNDGRPDVYLPHLGCGMLFHNLGGRFEDVTAKSGLGDCRNAVTAVPIDFDGDGKLDLYVVRYWKAIDYFHLLARGPRVWTENFSWSRNGGDNTLYRNRGDGTFEDVTASRGGSDTGWSWDAGAADFAGDGTQRIYVANDFGPDQIFDATEGKLAHIDTGTVLGLVDRRAGMGVSFGDLTHDGRPHIYVSNESTRYFSPQHGNFLWHFTGSEHADDEAYSRGVHNCGEWSWGALFADFDLDGKEDLYVAAGMITGNVESDFPMFDFIRRTGMTIPGIFADLPDWPSLKGRSLAGGVSDCVFWNRGDRFRDVSGFTGITKAWDGRAVAAIDFDNNGSLDLIVTTRTGQAHLLRNTVVPGQHWVAFALRGTRSNRDGAGARVEVRQAGQPPQFRWATAGKSGFLANSDPRIHFGLPVVQPLDVFVRWPSGKVDSHHGMDPGKIHTLVEGKDSE